jgi:hypothetical protein
MQVGGTVETVTVQVRPPGPGVGDGQELAKEVRAAQR